MKYRLSNKLQTRPGFTLIETLIALAISAIILSGLAMTTIQVINVSQSGSNKVTTVGSLDVVGNWISKDFEAASSTPANVVLTPGTHTMTLVQSVSSQGDVTVIYSINSAGNLYRAANGVNSMIASSISQISYTAGSPGTLQITSVSENSILTRAYKTVSHISAASLTVTSSSLADGIVSVAYSQTLAANGGAAPYSWSISSGTLPAGLSLNSSGLISGTPTVVGGPTSVTFMATDSASPTHATASKIMSITIDPALSITTTSSLPVGMVGLAYSQTLTASNGTTPYTWSVSSGTLPAGLTLSSGGVVSGTPTTAGGPTSVTFLVTDNAFPTHATANKAISITINPALSITTTSPLPIGVVGMVYNQTLAATGGTGPYTWSISSGTLPSGLSMSVGGVISGTPAAAGGPTSITFMATDSTSPTPATATKVLSITISSLGITTAALPNGVVSVAYSQTLTATGGTTPYSWAISSGTLPSGLSMSAGGVISGTPATAGGPNSLTFQVTDNASPAHAVATRVLTITVNPALSITTASPLANGVVGTSYNALLTATGGTTPYAWSISSGALPAGLSMTAGGIISGTPTAAGGPTNITFMATDSTNPTHATSTRVLSITISPVLTITTTSPLPTGVVGTAYSQTLAAAGGNSPYSWSITAGALPAGLSMGTNGVISGTPTTAGGPTNITFKVTDSTSPAPVTATQILSITVAAPVTLHLNPVTTTTDKTGASYTLTAANLTSLATNDANRYTTKNAWSSSYNDSTYYLNFVFSPNVPAGKTIDSANLSFIWQMPSGIAGAKLRISGDNGATWTDVALTLPALNTDSTVTLDLDTNYAINTLAKVNALLIRFEAYKSSGTPKTLHNLVQLDVIYH
jgi:prepilin-type N-terminal cleavage/methylation domain-containing protein